VARQHLASADPHGDFFVLFPLTRDRMTRALPLAGFAARHLLASADLPQHGGGDGGVDDTDASSNLKQKKNSSSSGKHCYASRNRNHTIYRIQYMLCSVAGQDPGLFYPLDRGSGINFNLILDPDPR
jgi:hypothetical protein